MKNKIKASIIDLSSCSYEFTASAELVNNIILGTNANITETYKTRGKYSDYTDYIKFKESDKLYNKGIKIINFKENSDNYANLTVEEKNLLQQVALIYLEDANRINIRIPDYLFHINKLKIVNNNCN